MGWTDRALATLTPVDVASRLDRAVRAREPQENYGALRRALPRMTALELVELGHAFAIPMPMRGAKHPDMLFESDERPDRVLAHFLTMPDGFNDTLAAYLQGHPRALAAFDDADAEAFLELEPRRRGFPYATLAAAGTVAAALGFGLARVLHW